MGCTYLNLRQPPLQSLLVPDSALCTSQPVLHILYPGPHALHGFFQSFVLLQGQLTAAQPLLGHSEKVLVAGKELSTPAASLPCAVAFFAEELPSLGELVKGLSRQTEFLFLVPGFWIQGSEKWLLTLDQDPDKSSWQI